MRKDVKSVEFIESEFSNFTIEYLGEIVTELKNILACLSRDTLTVLVSIDITVEEILREKRAQIPTILELRARDNFCDKAKLLPGQKSLVVLLIIVRILSHCP